MASKPQFSIDRFPLNNKVGISNISPGSIHGCRIAHGFKNASLFTCSSNRIFQVDLAESAPPINPDMNYFNKKLLPVPIERNGEVTELQSTVKHKKEIQNLISFKYSNFLASIDSNAETIIYKFDQNGSFESSFALETSKIPVYERFWTGIAKSEKFNQNQIVTARYSDRVISIYDYEQNKILRELKTICHPMKIQFMEENGLLALAEDGFYSLWDFRIPDSNHRLDSSSSNSFKLSGSGASGSCVQRIPASSSPIYAMDIHGVKIALAGAERSVLLFDIRGDGAESRWVNCIKYDVNHLLFYPKNPNLVIVTGLDNEISIGSLDGSVSAPEFEGPRIESHWAGLTFSNSNSGRLGNGQEGGSADECTLYGLGLNGNVYSFNNLIELWNETKKSQPQIVSSSKGKKQQQHQQAKPTSSPLLSSDVDTSTSVVESSSNVMEM